METKGRILAIDDEEPIRRYYKQALTTAGYDVAVAEDGLQALDLVQQRSFDLILMDIVMPQMDGVEAIRVLKAACDHIPVVVVTGNASEEAIRDARRSGGDHLLLKPFALHDLIGAIEQAMTESRQATPSD